MCAAQSSSIWLKSRTCMLLSPDGLRKSLDRRWIAACRTWCPNSTHQAQNLVQFASYKFFCTISEVHAPIDNSWNHDRVTKCSISFARGWSYKRHTGNAKRLTWHAGESNDWPSSGRNRLAPRKPNLVVLLSRLSFRPRSFCLALPWRCNWVLRTIPANCRGTDTSWCSWLTINSCNRRTGKRRPVDADSDWFSNFGIEEVIYEFWNCVRNANLPPAASTFAAASNSRQPLKG